MLCAYMHPPDDSGFTELQRRADFCQAALLAIVDRGPWDWHVPFELLQICRRERVHIWHGHDYKSNALGLLLARFWPMRLVTTVHGWVKATRRTPIYYGIDRLCLRYYERVICVSADLCQRCLESGVPTERCIVLENGIDTVEYCRRHSIEDAKRALGLSSERLLVGAVGRLSDEKGFDLLIRAVAHLLQEGLDLALWIVGEGDQRPRLQDLIVRLGLRERVRLLGYQSDTIRFYEAMDVFALSSLREGLPNVLLEALAMETPVVATRVAGIPQLIKHGTDGLLVLPGSEQELTQGLATLLIDKDLRARFATAGRRLVEDRYSFAVRMQKLSALYDGLLQTSEISSNGRKRRHWK